ncbi:potassium voltage-gated channel subfamily A member 10-like isoform X2 [Bolinopsis microptera]|uniref:potassium voltage-gated channel subfamily A member 10-like isoform X2 n=1 Tax=Bolinopsis microptera TaxID=2820187 RepID=UPI00307A4C2A
MQFAVKCKNYVKSEQLWNFEGYRKQRKQSYSGISSGGDQASLKKDDQSIESEFDNKPKVVDFGRDIVRVNVCGQEHFIHSTLLSKYPHTLLGSTERERYFRADLNSYYFDRNRHAFDAVMGYYLSGGVFMYPSKLNREVVHREMSFYKIPIYDEQEVTAVKMPVPTNFKEKAHMLLNYPKYSNLATALSVCDCVLIFIAVAMLILETEPQFKNHFEVTSDPLYNYLFGLNSVIMLYFTVDYLLRLFTHPTKKQFFKMFLPWLDMLSILPFYVEVIMMAFSTNQRTNAEDEKSNSGLVVLRLCRIFRVTRVFKFARRSENLLILLKAVGNTYKELILLSGVVSLAVVSFGSIMYTIESLPQPACYNETAADFQTNKTAVLISCEKTQFSSILISCWWAVITVTTVGYGDMIPLSTLGKCMGSFAVFCGLIIIALPATIIVTRFSEEYERSKMQNEMSPFSSVAM